MNDKRLRRSGLRATAMGPGCSGDGDQRSSRAEPARGSERAAIIDDCHIWNRTLGLFG
jgi:hypothetical protein